MESLLILLKVALIIAIWQILCLTDDFQLPGWVYGISAAITYALWAPIEHLRGTNNMLVTGFLLSYLWVLNMAFCDIKYREVSRHAYSCIMGVIVAVLVCEINIQAWMSHGFSLLVSYLFMLLYYKIGERLNEPAGGADIKIILLLAALYPFECIFMFLISVFAATVVLTAIYTVTCRNKKEKKSTPMLVSVAIAHIAFSYIYIVLPALMA